MAPYVHPWTADEDLRIKELYDLLERVVKKEDQIKVELRALIYKAEKLRLK